MKLGFITEYSEERVAFAGRAGFDCLEVRAEPGSPLDLNKLSDTDIAKVADTFAKNNVAVGTLQCAMQHLHSDPQVRAENNAYFEKALRTAKQFGTNIVMTQIYIERGLKPETQIAAYKEVFSRFAEIAEKENIIIPIENCPHWIGYPLSVGNLAASPELWDAMFDAVPSKRIGLEFDPSHLLWMGIDYIKAIRKYGDKILAFHAKDTEMLEDGANQYGILGRQIGSTNDWDSGWWRYRIPGWGDLDWQGIFRALNDISFDGVMVIEHEDPVFGGPRTDEGLLLGLRYLKQFML